MFSYRGRVSVTVAALSVSALLLAACGGASEPEAGSGANGNNGNAGNSGTETSEFGPELQAVVDAAREEGELMLNWGSGNLQLAVPILFEDFNEYYGLDLKLNHAPQSNIPKVMSQILQEQDAGKPASTDALWLGSAPHLLEMLEKDGIETDPGWGEWGESIPEETLEGLDGSESGMAVQTLLGALVYNTDLISEENVPRTPDDILNIMDELPIATTPYAAFFPQLGSDKLMGVEATRDYLKEFAPKVEGLIGCGDLDRVASGEFAGLFIACSQASFLALKEKGAPIGWAPIENMAAAQHSYVTFPVNAQHPNAARLWANFLMTPEAQETLYEHNYADSIHREGSKTAQMIAEMEEKGFEYVIVDVETQSAIPEEFENEAKGYIQK